ncbi:hypothetical protein K239x_43460 [Planctomycetes bacterium K23_9]|uniref:Uncharacterized protein n=1 Tax=Stieleria marina TaxID=1930275 RepID=A0A517NYY5_9BACT|nr:hypothetical protein K239x_43460 [Planctomycetes bacterium K23_9]
MVSRVLQSRKREYIRLYTYFTVFFRNSLVVEPKHLKMRNDAIDKLKSFVCAVWQPNFDARAFSEKQMRLRVNPQTALYILTRERCFNREVTAAACRVVQDVISNRSKDSEKYCKESLERRSWLRCFC